VSRKGCRVWRVQEIQERREEGGAVVLGKVVLRGFEELFGVGRSRSPSVVDGQEVHLVSWLCTRCGNASAFGSLPHHFHDDLVLSLAVGGVVVRLGMTFLHPFLHPSINREDEFDG